MILKFHETPLAICQTLCLPIIPNYVISIEYDIWILEKISKREVLEKWSSTVCSQMAKLQMLSVLFLHIRTF